VQPADATIDNPPADLFTKAGWAEFASGFWLGGCGGAAFAWFLAGTTIVAPLVKISVVDLTLKKNQLLDQSLLASPATAGLFCWFFNGILSAADAAEFRQQHR